MTLTEKTAGFTYKPAEIVKDTFEMETTYNVVIHIGGTGICLIAVRNEQAAKDIADAINTKSDFVSTMN